MDALLKFFKLFAAYPFWVKSAVVILLFTIIALLLIFRPDYTNNSESELQKKNAFNAGMGYNSIIQNLSSATHDITHQLPHLISQTQPYLDQLQLSIDLKQECAHPRFNEKKAIPIAQKISSDLDARHGRIISAIFEIGLHIGPTTGAIKKYISDSNFRDNISQNDINIINIANPISDPISIEGTVSSSLRKEWEHIIDRLRRGESNSEMIRKIEEWRERVRIELLS